MDRVVSGNCGLEAIVGDTLVYGVEIESGALDRLERVIFTCGALGMQRDFVLNDGGEWVVTFGAEETAEWCPQFTTWDMTLVFRSGVDAEFVVASETGLEFSVVRKKNPVSGVLDKE